MSQDEVLSLKGNFCIWCGGKKSGKAQGSTAMQENEKSLPGFVTEISRLRDPLRD